MPPDKIITDNGSNLNNKMMKELCSEFKIAHHNSSPYRPKINGAVEATNKKVKKIIRSLPKKWRPMVTSLKMENDLNSISLEELVSYLISHEIELEEDEPQKQGKSVALKSKPEKTITYQAEEEIEISDEDSKDDDD